MLDFEVLNCSYTAVEFKSSGTYRCCKGNWRSRRLSILMTSQLVNSWSPQNLAVMLTLPTLPQRVVGNNRQILSYTVINRPRVVDGNKHVVSLVPQQRTSLPDGSRNFLRQKLLSLKHMKFPFLIIYKRDKDSSIKPFMHYSINPSRKDHCMKCIIILYASYHGNLKRALLAVKQEPVQSSFKTAELSVCTNHTPGEPEVIAGGQHHIPVVSLRPNYKVLETTQIRSVANKYDYGFLPRVERDVRATVRV